MRRLLLGEEDAEIRKKVRAILPTCDWQIDELFDPEVFRRCALSRNYDIVITGRGTSAPRDLDILERIHARRRHSMMILLKGREEASGGDNIIAAMRKHAFSYFSAPFPPSTLAQMVLLASEESIWEDRIELVAATPSHVLLRARCHTTTAERLIQFFRELIADLPFSESESLSIAFRELLMNAMEHGGGFDEHLFVEVTYTRTADTISCRIKDPGKGFSRDHLPHSALSNPHQDPTRHASWRNDHGLRPGGYGLLVARESVDELQYNESGNEVHIVKYLQPPSIPALPVIEEARKT